MGFIWVYKPSYNWGAPSIMESHRQACGLVSVPRIPRSRERERLIEAAGRSVEVTSLSSRQMAGNYLKAEMWACDTTSKSTSHHIARICLEIHRTFVFLWLDWLGNPKFPARFPSDSLILNILNRCLVYILLLFMLIGGDFYIPIWGCDISNTVGIALASHGFAKQLRLWGDGDSPGESSQTQRADV